MAQTEPTEVGWDPCGRKRTLYGHAETVTMPYPRAATSRICPSVGRIKTRCTHATFWSITWLHFSTFFSSVHKASDSFLCFRVRGEHLAFLDSQETEECQESAWLDPLWVSGPAATYDKVENEAWPPGECIACAQLCWEPVGRFALWRCRFQLAGIQRLPFVADMTRLLWGLKVLSDWLVSLAATPEFWPSSWHTGCGCEWRSVPRQQVWSPGQTQPSCCINACWKGWLWHTAVTERHSDSKIQN